MTAPVRPQRGRRSARFVLLGGIAAVLAVALPAVPRDQALLLKLDDAHADVRRIDATWTRAGDHEPIGGVTLRFASPAPRLVRHPLSAPNGEYLLTIDVERAETSRPPQGTLPRDADAPATSASRTHFERRVRLAGEPATVLLDDGVAR
ncbi:MAG: hypothetical protein OZ921_07170 [Sorangiineae bacterium]|nr:hypothetical protein [Polyangiaceae bacterium]MEB2322276.1 hypothetical protein [Sorangiineae bacterium]